MVKEYSPWAPIEGVGKKTPAQEKAEEERRRNLSPDAAARAEADQKAKEAEQERLEKPLDLWAPPQTWQQLTRSGRTTFHSVILTGRVMNVGDNVVVTNSETGEKIVAKFVSATPSNKSIKRPSWKVAIEYTK